MSYLVPFQANKDESDVTLEQAAQGAYNAYGSKSDAGGNILTWHEFWGWWKLAAQSIPEFDQMTMVDKFKKVGVVFSTEKNAKALLLFKVLTDLKAYENTWSDGKIKTDEGEKELLRCLIEGLLKHRGYQKRVSIISDNYGLKMAILFGIPVMTFIQETKHIYNLLFYCMSHSRMCWTTQSTPHVFSTWLLMPKNSDGRGTPLKNPNLEHLFVAEIQKMPLDNLELETPYKFTVDAAHVKTSLNMPIEVEVLGVKIKVPVNGDFWLAAVIPASNRPILTPNAKSNAVPPQQHAAYIKLKSGRIVQYVVFDACGINEPSIGIEDPSYTMCYGQDMDLYISSLKNYIVRTQGMAICDNIFKEQGDRKELLNDIGGGGKAYVGAEGKQAEQYSKDDMQRQKFEEQKDEDMNESELMAENSEDYSEDSNDEECDEKEHRTEDEMSLGSESGSPSCSRASSGSCGSHSASEYDLEELLKMGAEYSESVFDDVMKESNTIAKLSSLASHKPVAEEGGVNLHRSDSMGKRTHDEEEGESSGHNAYASKKKHAGDATGGGASVVAAPVFVKRGVSHVRQEAPGRSGMYVKKEPEDATAGGASVVAAPVFVKRGVSHVRQEAPGRSGMYVKKENDVSPGKMPARSMALPVRVKTEFPSNSAAGSTPNVFKTALELRRQKYLADIKDQGSRIRAGMSTSVDQIVIKTEIKQESETDVDASSSQRNSDVMFMASSSSQQESEVILLSDTED